MDPTLLEYCLRCMAEHDKLVDALRKENERLNSILNRERELFKEQWDDKVDEVKRLRESLIHSNSHNFPS